MDDRHFSHFHIAGFTYYDGVDVFDQLKIGAPLKLTAEPDNKFDPYAVAIYFQNHKLGYVPRDNNEEIHKFLLLGYEELFAAKVNRVSPDEHPEQQIGVIVKLRAKQIVSGEGT
ncbi:MAG: HIRAN domain-containing protein [Spirochaetales bacterium]|nr:HIRAN domain-containing protein [Spirochaetales bacterium]